MSANVKIYQGSQIGGCVTVITYTPEISPLPACRESEKHNPDNHAPANHDPANHASANHDPANHGPANHDPAKRMQDPRVIRIMIDYGQSLPGSEITEDFRYDWEKEPVDGVFFTHCHGDHIGRFAEIPSGVKLYMGAVTRKLMINIQTFLKKSRNPRTKSSAEKALSILCDNDRIVEVTQDKPIVFRLPGENGKTGTQSAVTVTGYTIDHSVYNAYMYLIETPDQTILHTGDFRGHGYRGKATLPLIETYVRRYGKRNVDILITEGTMMNRGSENIITEADLQKEAAEYFKDHKYVFLICSSTNLDSLASFYNAAQKAKPHEMRMYTYSEYVLQQLRTFTEAAGKYTGLYQFRHVYTLNLNHVLRHKSWEQPRTQKELMREYGFLAIIKPEDFCEKYIDEFLDLKPSIIYSLWDGYLNPRHKAYRADWDIFLKRQEAKGVEVKHLHTSGHADTEMLAEMIEAVDPKEAIYPIHTENAAGFYELPIRGELKRKIRI